LLTNRQGKLTSDQWKNMVMEPVVALLVLLLPGVFILGPRLVVIGRAMWMFALLLVVFVIVPVIWRAYRYARIPIRFDVLYLADSATPIWKFWQPPVMRTKAGELRSFTRRLAPNSPLNRSQPYLVYYFEDAGKYVLLSVAPANHPDADKWRPGTSFESRFLQRGGQR
jgi:hypothetical protein